jgi:TetR/AcrR family transcriptional regulator, lmrAB and yxaGH operons repressor
MATPREHILIATRSLIERQGYHATGLNQIIQESGSPKGSLYHYFPGGKEDLVIEAIRQSGEEILQNIRNTLAQTDDPVQAIQIFIQTLAYYVELSGFQAGGPITIVAVEMASTNARLREECQRVYQMWQEVFAQKLTGASVPLERAQAIAVFILASLEGGIILCRASQSRAPLDQIAAQIPLLIQLV